MSSIHENNEKWQGWDEGHAHDVAILARDARPGARLAARIPRRIPRSPCTSCFKNAGQRFGLWERRGRAGLEKQEHDSHGQKGQRAVVRRCVSAHIVHWHKMCDRRCSTGPGAPSTATVQAEAGSAEERALRQRSCYRVLFLHTVAHTKRGAGWTACQRLEAMFATRARLASSVAIGCGLLAARSVFTFDEGKGNSPAGKPPSRALFAFHAEISCCFLRVEVMRVFTAFQKRCDIHLW